MKKILLLAFLFLILPSSIQAQTMAEDFTPIFRDTQINNYVHPRNIRLEKWIKNLPQDVHHETLKNLDPTRPGLQKGQVKLTFSDGSTKLVDVPVEVLGPFIVDEGPVRLGEVINPLDRVSNIPRGWEAYHTLRGTTDQLGMQEGKNRNQVNFRAPGITTVLLRFWLQVIDDDIQVDFAFKAEDQDALPDQVLDLLPKAYREKDLAKIQPPALSKNRVDLEDGTWLFKGWTREESIKDKQKRIKFTGTWAYTRAKNHGSSDKEKDKGALTFIYLPSQEGKRPKESKDLVLYKAYIKGYGDGTFRPEKPLSRAEGLTMLARLEGVRPLENYPPVFKDVDRKYWASPYIYGLYQAGKVKGYEDSSFKPDQEITRAEFLQVLMSFRQVEASNELAFKDISGHWAKDTLQAAYKEGLIKGLPDGRFKPDQALTRAEAVQILNASYHRKDLVADNGRLIQTQSFTDISNHWAREEIQLAASDIIKEETF